MAIRRPAADAKPVHDDVAAILLAGWMASPPGGAEPGFATTLDLFTEGNDYMVGLWRAHGAYLRRLAVLWGIEPRWTLAGERLYFGEYLDRGGR